MDVIEDRGPAPVLVLSMVQRLPDDSLTMALAQGGRAHFGWGTTRHLLADVYDAINQNTRATGNWAKGKVPTFAGWPRPKAASKATPTKKKVTVADIHKQFSRR